MIHIGAEEVNDKWLRRDRAVSTEKIEIDVGSLHKREGYIWIEATEKRVGHYRKARRKE